VKRKLGVLLVITVVGALLFFCIKGENTAPTGKLAGAGNKPTTSSAPVSMDEREQSIRAKIIAKYGDKIEWLAFSEVEHAEERGVLQAHYAKLFEEAEKVSKQRVRIQIAQADLNGDGRTEFIWKLVHRFFHGASTSSTLGISYYDGDRLKHVKHFPIQWGPIGLRPSETAGWKEMVMYDKLYRWDGKMYSYVEEPLETLAEEKYFRVTRDTDKGYTVTVFGEGKTVVEKFRHIEEPRVAMVSEDILRIGITWSGRGEPTYEYYDRKSKRLSRMYDNVLAERENRVVYIDSNKLIISDMFDRILCYKELARDFSPATPPRKAFVKVEWEKPNKIVVEYLAGEERRVVTEEIVLEKESVGGKSAFKRLSTGNGGHLGNKNKAGKAG
jgi:hypothetical protein